jgi:hypothetical protein
MVVLMLTPDRDLQAFTEGTDSLDFGALLLTGAAGRAALQCEPA